MTQALASVATGIAGDPAAIPGLTSRRGTEGARTLFDLLGDVRARHRDARRHCRHGVRRHGPRPRVERPAVRYPGRSHERRPRPVRPALGARAAPRPRLPHHRPRLATTGLGGSRARPLAGGRRRRHRARRRLVVTRRWRRSRFRLPSEGAGEQQPRLGTFVLRTPAGADAGRGLGLDGRPAALARGVAALDRLVGRRHPRRHAAAADRSAARHPPARAAAPSFRVADAAGVAPARRRRRRNLGRPGLVGRAAAAGCRSILRSAA